MALGRHPSSDLLTDPCPRPTDGGGRSTAGHGHGGQDVEGGQAQQGGGGDFKPVAGFFHIVALGVITSTDGCTANWAHAFGGRCVQHTGSLAVR